MLLSLEKNFIFVHIPKTAGTSVTKVLQPYCVRPAKTPLRRLLSRLAVPEDPRKAFLRQHDRASWIRLKVSPRLFDAAFTFAIVRNPYDLAVSAMTYLRANPLKRRHAEAQGWDFRAYLGYLGRKNLYSKVDQTSWIADRSGEIIVDRVLRFETLDEDFAAILQEIGLSDSTQLPRANASNHRNYRSYYDDETRGIVERLYKRDLERFGYSF